MTSLLLMICVVVMTAGAFSIGGDRLQTLSGPQPAATPTPSAGDGSSLYRSYRGVTVRMPAAQVTEKLGTPAQHSKAGDYYAISATESVQISYDAEQNVKSITINFTGDLKAAPTAKDVVGEDVKKDADGTISKLVSFPKDGYWASYTRTSGKDATVIITLQKLASQ